MEVDCTGVMTNAEAEKRILARIEEKAEGFSLTNIALRLNLTGSLTEQDAIDLALLEESLREKLYFLSLRDARSPEVNLDILKNQESLKGYFVQELYARRRNASEEEKRVIDRAMRLGLDAFDGKELQLAHFTD